MELNYFQEVNASIKIMPLRHANGFHHPDYQNKFTTGFSEKEINILYELGFTTGIAVFHGVCNQGLMALDFDEKNAPSENLFDNWKRIIDDLLFQKLVIEKTRSNGYHVYFKCMQIAPEKALASSPTGAEWIALRSDKSNCITYCAPSPGYTEIQGSLFDIQEITYNELIQLSDAAASLNKYDGKFSQGKNSASVYPKPPAEAAAICRLFDQEIYEMFIPELLTETFGWNFDDRTLAKPGKKKINHEDWEYIKLYRPGKNKRDKGTSSANYWINKKRLTVFSSSTNLPHFQNEENLSFSHSPSQVIYYLNNANWKQTVEQIKAICEKHEIQIPATKAMVQRVGKSWQVDIEGVIEWMKSLGFRWVRQSADVEQGLILVRIVDNIIYQTTEQNIIHEFTEEIKRTYNADEEMNRVLFRFVTSIQRLIITLPFFEEEVYRDTKNKSYLFFRNTVLEISADNIKQLKYSELKFAVWSRHIINHDYETTSSEGDFKKFLMMLSVDEIHFKSIINNLGYLLHSYKNKKFSKALVIIEDVDDESEARGRSGKGLIAQFVELIRNTVQQDGRNYNTDDRFKMQRVDVSTQVFYLNDPAPTILFNQFYNMITDDFVIEGKGKKSFSIPFEYSPKLLVTTNYMPVLVSDSDKDRFLVMNIKKVFGGSYTVAHAFPDTIFFDRLNWNKYQFQAVFQLAIEGLQSWLKHGIIAYSNTSMEENIAKRAIQTMVPEYIVETMDQLIELGRVVKDEFEFNHGIDAIDHAKYSPDSLRECVKYSSALGFDIYISSLYRYCIKAWRAKISDKVFSKKLRLYLEKNAYEFTEIRNNVSGKRLFIKVNTKKEVKFGVQNDPQDTLESAPF